MPDNVQVIIEPVETVGLSAGRLAEAALRVPRVAELLGEGGGRLLVSEPEVMGRKEDEDSPFRATLFAPATNRAVEVAGRLGAPDDLSVRPVAYAPRPGFDELREAAEVLRGDQSFASLAGRDDVVIYQPMPPLADLEADDGTLERRPTLARPPGTATSPTGA